MRAARGRILGRLGGAPLETPKPRGDFYLDIAGFKSTFEHSMKLMMPKLEYYYGPYQNDQPLNSTRDQYTRYIEDDFNISMVKPR